MNRLSFLTHFLFTPIVAIPLEKQTKANYRMAAVLIALVERDDGLHVIFTERALHLKHHPGQVSFPGGKYEQSDESLQHTAQRETAEEIGIEPHLVQIVGQLSPLNTTSGFEVYPFIGFVDNSFTLKIDPQEVKAVFEVPLLFLLNNQNYYLEHLLANKKRHFTYCIPYQNHLIWGATAQILKNLQASFI